MPIVVTQKDGTIIWYNRFFNQIIEDKEIVGNNLNQYLPQLDFNHLREEENRFEPVSFNDKIYSITCSPVVIDRNWINQRRYLYFIGKT